MLDTEEVGLNDSFIEAPISAISHPLYPLHGVNNTASRSHINIAAYNIFLRPPLVKNNESDHKDSRLKEFIKQLPEFDIVCLQEMFGFLNKRKHKLIRCATKAGFLYYADSTSPSFFTSFVVDGGLLVLSRFPILASEFKPYPYGIFSDALSQKGVLYTKIQIKDEILHLFSTHTQASYFGENQKYPILTRADQFTMLRQFITTVLPKNNYKDGELVLIVGDFNVDSRHPFIETNKIQQYPGFKEYPHLGSDKQFNEYDAMTCYLSDNGKDVIDDLLLNRYGEHPITYADSRTDDDSGDLKPLETVLTHKDDLCSNQSLDYIFRLHPKGLAKTKTHDIEQGGLLPNQSKLQIIGDSAKVERFFVDNNDFTQLSDHYGTMVTLEYKSSAWEERGELLFPEKNNMFLDQQMKQEKILML
jgi:endonuclease/exonuclease/phosphatase family metal-dependent hydrolase